MPGDGMPAPTVPDSNGQRGCATSSSYYSTYGCITQISSPLLFPGIILYAASYFANTSAFSTPPLGDPITASESPPFPSSVPPSSPFNLVNAELSFSTRFIYTPMIGATEGIRETGLKINVDVLTVSEESIKARKRKRVLTLMTNYHSALDVVDVDFGYYLEISPQ